MQKRTVNLIGIVFVVIVIIILIGGVFAYEYLATKESPTIQTNQKNIQDEADANQPSITITSPIGGEQWQLGTTHLITWDASGFQDQNARIFISIADYNNHEGGYPNKQYAIHIGPDGGNDSFPITLGSYSWTIIPSDFPISSKMKVNISSVPSSDAFPNEVVSSDSNYFSIVAPITNQTQNTPTSSFTFSMSANGDYKTNIAIANTLTGKIVQTITVPVGLSDMQNVKDSIINNIDINFDGYNDLAIMVDLPADNPPVYDFYEYNQITGSFDKDSVLHNLVGPVFNSSAKTITTGATEGCRRR